MLILVRFYVCSLPSGQRVARMALAPKANGIRIQPGMYFAYGTTATSFSPFALRIIFRRLVRY